MGAIAVVSGGLDSTVMMYSLAASHKKVYAIAFDYGQKSRELLHLPELCAFIGAAYRIVDIKSVFAYPETQSALLAPNTVADDTMQSTYVPNRNTIMLAIAWSWAITIKASIVAAGCHASDQYPDASRAAFKKLQTGFAESTKNYGGENVKLVAPFAEITKEAICRLGNFLEVPFEWTWSCYAGNEYHCGKCRACVHRKDAFENSGVHDPTIYEA